MRVAAAWAAAMVAIATVPVATAESTYLNDTIEIYDTTLTQGVRLDTVVICRTWSTGSAAASTPSIARPYRFWMGWSAKQDAASADSTARFVVKEIVGGRVFNIKPDMSYDSVRCELPYPAAADTSLTRGVSVTFWSNADTLQVTSWCTAANGAWSAKSRWRPIWLR